MSLKPNRAVESIRANKPAYGSWVQMNAPEICELEARSGLDFVIIDMEHGSFGIESAVRMITAVQAGGSTPFVRIADYAPATILKVLDAGAAGLIVPGVETAEQMRAIVRASRYAPDGTRGACPCTRSTGHGIHGWAESVAWARENVMIVGIVETPKGIANYSEIVKVEGLNAIGVGQFDLSQAMGLAGDHTNPQVLDKQEELAREAREAGVEVLGVIFSGDPEEVRSGIERWRRIGSRLIAISGDRFMLSTGYQRIAQVVSEQR